MSAGAGDERCSGALACRSVSYYGTILMTRTDLVMSRLPRIESIGFRHRRLRELGDGWQVLETSGWNDPPDLEQAVAEAAAGWSAPVFAAYVSDICAQIHGTAPGAATWSGHLPDAADTACGMLHRPRVRAGASVDILEAQIVKWAAGVGLALSTARLGRALRYRQAWRDDSDGPYLFQFEQIFELVRAFGFPVIPAPRAYEFDPDDQPFAEVTAGMWGLASQARSAAAYRNAGARTDAPADWEADAIALEMDVYASLFGGAHPVVELVARAERVSSAYRAARQDTLPPPREVAVHGRPVTNIQRITHDLGPRMIANQLAVAQRFDEPTPNGTTFGDPTAGTGIWPDLA
jgi:hypothetical protein